ncbi:MAG: STAS domain-containing protein [Verrucomicrobiae bacterium]|nr:STAS domain-containing protein [Verrucomicrobiae bacterium]
MIPVVSLACIDENVWIRVIGRGSFQCSPCLKKIVQEQLEQGRYDYIIDLGECEQLDSTFMGTLTGIAQRLKIKKEGSLRVINVSEGNKQLMENLGLDQLFSIRPIAEGKECPSAAAEHAFFQVTEAANISKKSVEETVRSAHEALVTANQANAPKFQGLLEMM